MKCWRTAHGSGCGGNMASVAGPNLLYSDYRDAKANLCRNPKHYSYWAMLTDAPPRQDRQTEFLKSDRITSLDLPPNSALPVIAKRIEAAMAMERIPEVRSACADFLSESSTFYKVPSCGIRVLAARPLRVRENWATELFGDYAPETMVIRVWMRTAVRKQVTSFGTFLSTLCHEFCHHLDFQRFGFPNSWHTRGFYERSAALYHYARGTPPKRLFWVPMSGGRWRIDWPRTTWSFRKK